jgi:uncharacterized protein with GYD domain
MATFIVMITETQVGEERIKDTVSRADEFKTMAAEHGVEIKGLYWTMGSVDGVVILEASDGATVAGLLYKLMSRGNVRTQSMRAFDADEMSAILA